MKRSLFALSLGIAILTPCIVQGQHSGDSMKETWQCFDRYSSFSNKVLVTLSGAVRNKNFGLGEVSVAGVIYSASFRVVGFDRRWDFGDEYAYAFIIQPDGHGMYYDFSKVKDSGSTGPSQHFRCESP